MSNENEYPVADLAALLAVKDSKEEYVSIPQWELRVKVRSLSKAEQVRLRKRSSVHGVVDDDQLQGLILVNGIVEPKMSAEHIDAMFEKNSGVVDHILKRILTLSGMMGEQKKLEDAEADFPE